MSGWLGSALVAAAVLVVVWGVLALLARTLPAGLLRDIAGFLPACVGLARRLWRDPDVPRSARLVLVLAALWVLSPIDLVPEFLPVVGLLDDVVVVALALRFLARRTPRDVVLRAWTGDPGLLERLSGP
jgi:uncharacterized membrane protein YkvA (DUF1232 family)